MRYPKGSVEPGFSNELKVQTGADGDLVWQKLDILGEISYRFINVAAAQLDKAVFDRLIELGWTPPPEKPE